MGFAVPLFAASSGLAAFGLALLTGGPAIVAFSIVAAMGSLVALMGGLRGGRR